MDSWSQRAADRSCHRLPFHYVHPDIIFLPRVADPDPGVLVGSGYQSLVESVSSVLIWIKFFFIVGRIRIRFFFSKVGFWLLISGLIYIEKG